MTFDFLMPFDDVERSPSHTSIPTTRTAPMETLYHTINLFIKFIVKHKKKKDFLVVTLSKLPKTLRILLVFSLSLYKLSIQITMFSTSGMLVHKELISRLAIYKLGSCLQIFPAKRNESKNIVKILLVSM